MSRVTCRACDAAMGDDELLCPKCGACQIPQQSKVELQEEIDTWNKKVLRPTLWGLALGFLLGVVAWVAVLTGIPPQPFSLDYGSLYYVRRWTIILPITALGAVLGAIAGLVIRRQHR